MISQKLLAVALLAHYPNIMERYQEHGGREVVQRAGYGPKPIPAMLPGMKTATLARVWQPAAFACGVFGFGFEKSTGNSVEFARGQPAMDWAAGGGLGSWRWVG